MSAQPVDRLLAVIKAGVVPSLELVADEVGFDATVPNWRFTVLVSKAVSSGMYLLRYAENPRRTSHLAGALCDGSILAVTLRRYRAATR